jgi:hypothetical protein
MTIVHAIGLILVVSIIGMVWWAAPPQMLPIRGSLAGILVALLLFILIWFFL